MQPLWILLGGLLLLTGCQNLPPPEVIEPTPVVRPVRLQEPMDGGVGRVISVNARLRFVLLDYSLNTLPKIGDVVELWREDQVVGELKVTGPIRNTTVLADMVSGEPRVGDQARPKRGGGKAES
jgi:hypothetical protein